MSEYVNYDGLKRYDELIKNVISVKTWMGSCSTAAGTAAKVISVESGFKLLKGVRVGVKFTNSNTASNVTLNVNSTGAKSIYYNNAVYTGTSDMICGYANRYVFYVYDGTNWIWDGYSNHDNTTYSSKAAVANGTDVSLVTTGEKAAWNAKTSNTGTITGIKMNGVSKGTSGVVDLGTVITAHQDISGKVDKTTTVNGHALNGNVSVTASDVGLGNVGNFKAVSTALSQGLTDTEKSNARTNIGAGTSSFSGSYNDLTNKPTIPTVNNATLTIQKNGTTVKTFTANASSNVTANITVPTKVSELTNDSGYTTNTGTVTSVKVGTTSYSPSSGVISLPAYPTSLPANGGTASNVSGTVAIGNGGTGATTAANARTNLGLGNVGNFKAVSTVASQGLTDTEKSNARANIGAGTSSFSGSYNDLSNKPTIPASVTELTVSGWGFAKSEDITLDYTETTTGITNLDATLLATALRKTALTLTSAEQTLVKLNLGIRNITISTSEPTSSDGNDGDIWLVYES